MSGRRLRGRECRAADCGGENEDGNREILGVSVSLGEHEVHWRNFLQSMVSRGLSGVELITSDDHLGLKSAGKAVFGGVLSPVVGGPTFPGNDVSVTCSVTLRLMFPARA